VGPRPGEPGCRSPPSEADEAPLLASEPVGGRPQDASRDPSLDRIVTAPNLISLVRILSIPVFVVLLQRRETEVAGLALLVAVASTDWIDGQIARRTGQVSNLGKILDPVADRLTLAAALIALVVRGAFPLWAALLVLVRDGILVLAGGFLLLRDGVRIDVRWSGKVATLTLMAAIPLVAWGRFERPFGGAASAVGWTLFALGIALYLVATAQYAIDARRALGHRLI
jgi:cardiolipin synthase (CMP-forming)